MENANRFDGRGEIYARSRPKYAEGLFTYMEHTLGIAAGSVFADVGSGTGIFTLQLLRRGYKVFAVEPGTDMRSRAEEALAGYERFVSVCGTADATHLPEQSVDHLTAAQAFHWFDPEAFRQECRRIVRPGGYIMLVYNFRSDAPCTRALAELQRRYAPDFRGFSHGMNEEKCAAFFGGNCTVYRADNAQHYDRQSYVDRVLSSSYSPRAADAGYEEYRAELCAIFDAFAIDGQLTVPADTVAFIGRV